MNFEQKKILFLSAHFFGYEKAIAERLRNYGATVDFFNERPADSVLSKGLVRLKSRLYHTKIEIYYRGILKKIKNSRYDFFLLIKGEAVPLFFLKEFRRQNPAAQMIFYCYDSSVEYPKFRKLYPYFDKNFTFEPEDAVQYQLHFRPLFFLKEYEKKATSANTKYDLVFVGTAHSDRYLIGEQIRKLCSEHSLRTFFYYYASGKTAFLLKKIFDKNLKKFNPKKLSFKKLNHAEIAKIYGETIAVLDINKPFQKGLTMRTFEVLAAGKKLVTTNSDIRNYPFYNDENILILDRQKLEMSRDFFAIPFQEISPEILEKMSLDSWLHCLFVEPQDDFWRGNLA